MVSNLLNCGIPDMSYLHNKSLIFSCGARVMLSLVIQIVPIALLKDFINLVLDVTHMHMCKVPLLNNERFKLFYCFVLCFVTCYSHN